MATESRARDRSLGIPDDLDDMAKASLRREAAIAQQQGLSGAGIPEPVAQKPTLVVIEGGKE
jgi:excinuclease UvrABC nuclease subunit